MFADLEYELASGNDVCCIFEPKKRYFLHYPERLFAASLSVPVRRRLLMVLRSRRTISTPCEESPFTR
jgi:hypothetical protein